MAKKHFWFQTLSHWYLQLPKLLQVVATWPTFRRSQMGEAGISWVEELWSTTYLIVSLLPLTVFKSIFDLI